MRIIFRSLFNISNPRSETISYKIILKRVAHCILTHKQCTQSHTLSRSWRMTKNQPRIKESKKIHHRIIPINRRITFFAHVIMISTSYRKQISLFAFASIHIFLLNVCVFRRVLTLLCLFFHSLCYSPLCKRALQVTVCVRACSRKQRAKQNQTNNKL